MDPDEGRHTPGPERWWAESWYFDFVGRDGSRAGYVRLGLYPNQGVAWYWLHLVGDGLPTVQLRDHGLGCPPGDRLAVENESFSAHIASRPGGRWELRAEGDAVALADPLEAYGAERGSRVRVRADLAWEGRGPLYRYSVTTRYEQTSVVSGEILIGGDRFLVEAPGQRDHSWGVRDWAMRHCWTSGCLEDGTAYHLVEILGTPARFGYILTPSDEMLPLGGAELEHEWDEDLMPVSFRARLEPPGDGLVLRGSARHHAPVLLQTPDGRGSRFPRSCVELLSDDGRSGWGWLEYNFPGADRPGASEEAPGGRA
jgi:hypothetical protein